MVTADPIFRTEARVSAIQPDLFRALLRRHAAGVVIITAAGEAPVGFTATSFTSVSLHPPLVSFCLNRSSSTWHTVTRTGHVGVHLLSEAEEELARVFATSGVDRFAPPVRWHVGPHGVPILAGPPTVLVCRIVERMPAGDHTIILAEPIDGGHTEEPTAPLLYHMGQYRRAA